eukprot:m.391219 g.391219  ORF g.391219 m.391219 type:complete len:499 (-) comp56345_c0_seq11:495-1991(-)
MIIRVYRGAALFPTLRWTRILSWIVQLLWFPFGIAIARVFQCGTLRSSTSADSVMVVYNSVVCGSTEHMIIKIPFVVIGLLSAFVFTLVFYRVVRKEAVSSSSARHEAYLQIKEIEYVRNVDFVWAASHFYMFSSYRRPWAFMKPLLMAWKTAVILVYGLLYEYPSTQALLLLLLQAALFAAILCRKPYRVPSFNVASRILAACNTANALLLFMKVEDINNVMLQEPYLQQELEAVNMVATIVIISFILWCEVRHLLRKPMWGIGRQDLLDDIPESVRIFMAAILNARTLLERNWNSPPLIAPAHELSRYIHIVNALCREAMKEQDFLSDSLWQLLDELIEAHNSVSPDCIFRFGTKRSTRETAENLLQIMPHFAKRLRQRDYDMMFIQPRLRRCLLKMYCLSAFVHDASGKRHTGARFVPPQLDWNKVENEAVRSFLNQNRCIAHSSSFPSTISSTGKLNCEKFLDRPLPGHGQVRSCHSLRFRGPACTASILCFLH